jgi:hypothetical protein
VVIDRPRQLDEAWPEVAVTDEISVRAGAHQFAGLFAGSQSAALPLRVDDDLAEVGAIPLLLITWT